MENMDAQDYIDAIRAKKRQNLIIGLGVVVLLALFMVPRLLSMFGPDGENLETVLAQVPELALTQAEKDMAETILETDTFRNSLTYEATGVTTFAPEDVQDIIAPVLPENAVIIEIGVQGAVVYIDYYTEDLRTTLEYVDADRSGSVDRICKGVAPIEPQPEPFVPKSLAFYQISYDIRTGETQLLASDDYS